MENVLSCQAHRAKEGTGLSPYLTLTKPRLTLLILFTVGAGFVLGASGRPEGPLLGLILLGVGLVAGGTSALNQYLERDLDARMERTANRPLPSGTLPPQAALAFGIACCGAGLLTLGIAFPPATAFLTAACSLLNLLAYTPLKRRSSLSTLIGAVTGALPILIGWTAAAGKPTLDAWILFGILFIWQMPHFLALSLIYKEDYARAGMQMLSVLDDPDGKMTSRQIVLYSVVLVPTSLMPAVSGLAGSAYFGSAAALSLGMLLGAVRLRKGPSIDRARRLFRYSLVYIPVLLLALMLDQKGG
jgi:protoheme IX farnesyltransferase